MKDKPTTEQQLEAAIAALKKAQRVIHGSDGNDLPAIRREEKIDEIIGAALDKLEQ